MKVTWLGQAGFMIQHEGKVVILDPYLSNSVEKINPKNYRRCSIDEDFFKIKPDMIILTHDHLDHTDPETLEKYLKNYSGITVLASQNAWNNVRTFGGDHNYVMFNRHTVWTEGDMRFTGVLAEHSDNKAIGVIAEIGGKTLYFTGDTLYNTDIFADIKKDIDVLFLPINGVGNNMNMIDGAKFAEKIGAKKVVPMHFGLFDELNPNNFECENKVIPQIYKEVMI